MTVLTERGPENILLFGAILLLMAVLVAPKSGYSATDPLPDRPHWSLELKGGYFQPAADNWATYYGDDKTWQIGGSVAYKLVRQLEAGIEGGLARDRGTGYAPLNGILTGEVQYDVFPLNIFLLVRGVFREQQWLVPYAGGGYTRMYYREKIEGQGTVRGSTNGYHARGGIQLLLDGLDTGAANNMYLDYGIHHTYLFFEAQYIRANANTVGGGSVDLGGISYLGGFLFEF
jgi:hypothetical protein